VRDQKRLANRKDVRLSARSSLQLFLVKVFVMKNTHYGMDWNEIERIHMHYIS